MRAVIHTLQANFAEIGTNETGKLGGPFVDCSFRRFGNRIKEQQVDIVTVFTPLPDADDTAIHNNGRQRIIDEFALPSGKRFIRMFGRDETIEYLALSLKVGVAVRNEIDHEVLRLEREEVIEFRFANQEFIGGSFNPKRPPIGFCFFPPPQRTGGGDYPPPTSKPRSRGGLRLVLRFYP